MTTPQTNPTNLETPPIAKSPATGKLSPPPAPGELEFSPKGPRQPDDAYNYDELGDRVEQGEFGGRSVEELISEQSTRRVEQPDLIEEEFTKSLSTIAMGMGGLHGHTPECMDCHKRVPAEDIAAILTVRGSNPLEIVGMRCWPCEDKRSAREPVGSRDTAPQPLEKQVYELRQKDWKQQRIAERLGIKQPYVSKLLAKAGRARLDTME